MVAMALIILGALWWRVKQPGSGSQRPANDIVSKMCSAERYQGTLERCQTAGKVFFRTHPGQTVMDAPDGLYDEQGNLLTYCGGLVPASADTNRAREICQQYPTTNCQNVTSWCQ